MKAEIKKGGRAHFPGTTTVECTTDSARELDLSGIANEARGVAANEFGCDPKDVQVSTPTLTTAEDGDYRMDVEARNTRRGR
ncbi:hypothetical protein [Actinoallomurus sp. NPDC052274]|uniref:hypothetical protein n=1 Tax=Actinoallomurus sp. NPDC052274 TaxID=3155420 RepID=UPI0034472DBE